MYKEIVNMTFLPVFENKEAIIKAVLVPLMCIIVLTKVAVLNHGNMSITVSSNIIILLLNVFIAISVHRILLLGKGSVPLWGVSRIRKREVVFILTSILIALIVAAIMAVGIAALAMKLPNIIALPIMLVASIVALITFSRLSLVLPSIAINEPLTLKEAWNCTKNYKQLTFFTIIFFPLAITLVVGVIYTIIIKFLMGIISVHFDIFFPVLDVFLTVFMVSALSATYQFIKEKEPQAFPPSTHTYEDVFLNNIHEKQEPEEIEEVQNSINNQENQTQNSEIIIALNNEEFTVNLQEFPVSFNSIKQELIKQYENESLSNIVVDKEDSWIAKHPENEEMYIALQENPDGFDIEFMNVKEVDLNEGMRESTPKGKKQED